MFLPSSKQHYILYSSVFGSCCVIPCKYYCRPTVPVLFCTIQLQIDTIRYSTTYKYDVKAGMIVGTAVVQLSYSDDGRIGDFWIRMIDCRLQKIPSTILSSFEGLKFKKRRSGDWHVKDIFLKFQWLRTTGTDRYVTVGVGDTRFQFSSWFDSNE